MAIFWGFGSKSKNPGGLWVPYYCSSCQQLSAFAVTENYKYGQVYGIRIAKYKAKYFLVCQKCDRVMVVENKERFAFAQSIGTQIANKSSDNLDIHQHVKEVAKYVFQNTEFLQILEGLEAAEENLGKPEALSDSGSNEIGNAADDEKVCPDCAEKVKSAAKKCRFCNYAFS